MHFIDRRQLDTRSSSPLSTVPRPFLRWAGSKRWLLRQLVPYLPPRFRTYREPFLGSAALFFLLCPDRAVLSDRCGELVEVYAALARLTDGPRLELCARKRRPGWTTAGNQFARRVRTR